MRTRTVVVGNPPAFYQITNFPNLEVTSVTAFRDVNGSGTAQFWETAGQLRGQSVQHGQQPSRC